MAREKLEGYCNNSIKKEKSVTKGHQCGNAIETVHLSLSLTPKLKETPSFPFSFLLSPLLFFFFLLFFLHFPRRYCYSVSALCQAMGVGMGMDQR